MTHWSASPLVVVLAVAIACAPAERDTADTTLPDAGVPTIGEYGIALREWAVELAHDTMAAGPTVFVARNTGQYQHALEIEIEGTELETGPIPAGAEARLALDLWPGTYTVYCPVNDEHGNHRERGMRATLVVR